METIKPTSEEQPTSVTLEIACAENERLRKQVADSLARLNTERREIAKHSEALSEKIASLKAEIATAYEDVRIASTRIGEAINHDGAYGFPELHRLLARIAMRLRNKLEEDRPSDDLDLGVAIEDRRTMRSDAWDRVVAVEAWVAGLVEPYMPARATLEEISRSYFSTTIGINLRELLRMRHALADAVNDIERDTVRAHRALGVAYAARVLLGIERCQLHADPNDRCPACREVMKARDELEEAATKVIDAYSL